jgi:hypothetical protein
MSRIEIRAIEQLKKEGTKPTLFQESARLRLPELRIRPLPA